MQHLSRVGGDPIFIDESLYNELSKTGIPQPGDLMVTGIGTIGTTYIVQPGDRFYYKDASVLCFENRSEFSSLFLQQIMRTGFMLKQIRDSSVGTTVATITMKNAVTFLLPVPPLAEQRRIVPKVEEIMGLLKNQTWDNTN
ncbi:restriction endonuclease subunit S [Bifidobacterium pullorum]|uniref:restriction endonuclease subunit S n=1 Tax=Bifidobacterium pullorum TaxID=78448 RepID=UPI00242CAE57|nr:restriction endonuclease subunit S [Bifidobacterium pullorum]